MTEIERKFLIREIPSEIRFASHKRVRQGYIAIEENGAEVRVRQKGNAYFLTIKKGDGLIRNEFEVELTESQFELLWPATEGRRILKTRYFLPHNDALICVDVYDKPYEKLCVAEIEFSTLDASVQYIQPEWMDREVTFDERFKNRNLVLNGLPDLQA